MRRGLVFWGICLILLGAVPLAVQLEWIDRERLPAAWRLWPVALIVLGVAVLLRRSRVALVGTVLAALVAGAAGGTALAVGPGWIFDLAGNCGEGDDSGDEVFTDRGGFADTARVDLSLNCGDLRVTTAQGRDWHLTARHARDAPQLHASDDTLSVEGGDDGVRIFGDARRQDWDLSLPTDPTLTLTVGSNAGSSSLDLGGADLETLTASSNAGSLAVDLTDATVRRLDLSINAGSTALTLGREDVTGQVSVNAGSIELCAPADLALSLTLEENITFSHNLAARGLTLSGGTWETSGSDGRRATAELDIDGNAATLTLNPDDGCR